MEYTQYLTYLEYQELGGAIPENEFNMLERKSHRLLDYFTFNRIPKLKEVPEVLKDIMMEYIETFKVYRNSSQDTPPLTHYSNGVESFDFRNKSEKQISKELYEYTVQTLPEYLTARSVAYDLRRYFQSDDNNLK